MTSLIRVGPLVPLALALTLSACAGGGDDETEPARGDRTPSFEDLETRARDKLTFEDVEKLARVEIPASASDLRSFFQRFMDSRVIAGFRLPREDLDAFLSRNRFEGPLREGQVTVFAKTATGKEIPWPALAELERQSEHVSGLEEQNLPWGYRAVTVDRRDPARPAVYLYAAVR